MTMRTALTQYENRNNRPTKIGGIETVLNELSEWLEPVTEKR